MVLFLGLGGLTGTKVYAESSSVNLQVPVQQNILGQTVSYTLKGLDEPSVLSMNSSNSHFTLSGKDQRIISFSFSEIGSYHYQISPVEKLGAQLLSADQKSYQLDIYIQYRNGQLKAIMVAKNNRGEKVDQLQFSNSPNLINSPNELTPSNHPSETNGGIKQYPKTGAKESNFSWLGIWLIVGVLVIYRVKKKSNRLHKGV